MWLEMIFMMQLILVGLMILFLQRITSIKKQVDHITNEVMGYISYVTEDVKEELREESKEESKKGGKTILAEEQNNLIQSVLGEFFS